MPNFFSWLTRGALFSVLLTFGLCYAAETREEQPKYCRGYASAGYNVTAVARQARLLSSHSWEYGTAAEALLELYNPELSVFGENPFPGNRIPVTDWQCVNALAYVQPFILTENQSLIDGDGAVGDPASLGISAVLIGQTRELYLDAAAREADYVLNIAPRYWNGAISQRHNTPELWADFIYMAPPFLAYYAVATQNTILLNETIQQCGFYRQVLQANISSNSSQAAFRGAWEHIIGPNDYQPQLWATGNGWAAAGMARVLATTIKWGPSASWAVEQASLKEWIKEIIDSVVLSRTISTDPTDDLLRNDLNDTAWFGETSSSALLASVVYRMAVLEPAVFGATSGNGYLEWAEGMRAAVAGHVDPDGILKPAINPEDWGSMKPWLTGSPEGQSFGVLLAAAHRDWVCLEPI